MTPYKIQCLDLARYGYFIYLVILIIISIINMSFKLALLSLF